MRKLNILAFLLLFGFNVNAQVFNTAQTLKTNHVNIGLNPITIDDALRFFFHGGYGINPGFDFGLQVGLGLQYTYIGADFEWILREISPYISISAGLHSYDDFGLDGTMNFTFPLNRLLQWGFNRVVFIVLPLYKDLQNIRRFFY